MAIEKLNLRADSQDERFAQLKQLYPELFSDGNLNVEALKEACGLETEEDGYYGLYWPGKNEAKRLARKEATGTLEPVEGDGVNEETTHNIYIEGDNLEVLRTLKKSYQNRVKMIYIDPPYNTGNDFIYPDNYQEPVEDYLRFTEQMDDKGKMLVANPKSSGKFHRRWLNMMYPRLQLARELLTDDGVIFISIDDNEQANLKLLCDDVFGEGNFVGLLTIMSNPRGSQNSKNLSYIHEYIFVYSKNIDEIELKGVSKSEESLAEFKETDANGRKYRLLGLRKRGGAWRKEDRPKMFYPIFVDPKNGSCSLTKDKKHIIEVIPKRPTGELSRWTWGKEKFEAEKMYLYGKIVNEGREDEGWDVFRKDYIDDEDGNEKSTKLKTIWVEKEINYQNAKNEIKELFGNSEVFDFPKPTYIVEHLASIFYFDKKDIIMDFFSGSSSSAQAVMQFNLNNENKCKFIMVQLPVEIAESKEAYKLGYKNITSLAKERIRRAGAKILEEAKVNKDMFTKENPLDLGFKVYRLAKSNFTVFENIRGTDKSALDTLFSAAEKEPLTEGWKERKSSIITELCLRHGFVLDSKTTRCPEYTKNEVLKIVDQNEEKTMFVCLDEKINGETAKTLHLEDGEKFICLDSAIGDQLKVQLADKGRIETI